MFLPFHMMLVHELFGILINKRHFSNGHLELGTYIDANTNESRDAYRAPGRSMAHPAPGYSGEIVTSNEEFA